MPEEDRQGYEFIVGIKQARGVLHSVATATVELKNHFPDADVLEVHSYDEGNGVGLLATTTEDFNYEELHMNWEMLESIEHVHIEPVQE